MLVKCFNLPYIIEAPEDGDRCSEEHFKVFYSSRTLNSIPAESGLFHLMFEQRVSSLRVSLENQEDLVNE